MTEIKKQVSTSEKISIQMNVVELGYIDMLVKEGYYSNRTDFVKACIRKELEIHSQETNKVLEKKQELGYEYTIGIGGFTRKELQELKERNSRKKVVFVGLCQIARDIPLELITESIESIKVYGISRCSEEIKAYYRL